MARTNGPIQVWHRGDTIPTDPEGGYAGGDSTAAAVGGAMAQAGQAVATVDNLSATATALPPGATPTVTVTGPIPNKVINIGVPRGEPGMGYEEGQQLLADSQTAKTQAQSAATSAQASVTLAQQAQAAAYAVPDEALTAIQSNAASDSVKKRGVLVPADITHAGVQAALNSAATFGLRVQAAGAYSTSQTLSVVADCDLAGLTITYTGTGTAIKVGPDTGSLGGKTISLPFVKNGNKTTTGWGEVTGSIGIRLRNTVGCTITGREVAGFDTGILFVGDGSGNVHNRVAPGRLANNKVNLHLHAIAAGWTNENVFTGGHFFHYSGEAAGGSGAGMTGPAIGTRHVLMTSASTSWAGPNSNKFYGAAMENVGATEFTVDFDNAGRNLFDGCRWETWLGGAAGYPPRVRYGTVATENLIRGGYDAHRIKVTSVDVANSRGNNITSPLGGRFHFQNHPQPGPGAVGGWILDNTSGVTAPLITAMRASWEYNGDDPATAWVWRWTGTVLEGKRNTDVYPRIRIDANLGQFRIGPGSVEPTAGFVGSASDMRTLSTVAPLSNNAYDLGVGSVRWRNAYVQGEVHVGSLILRDQGGVLQCWQGGAWKTVNLS